MKGITRRALLHGAGWGTLTLALAHLRGPEAARAASPGKARGEDLGPSAGNDPAYASWQDVYRRMWTWDRVVKGTHHVNCWYQRGCTWHVFVKDGLVWREEQAGNYAQTNPAVPDFNPRGCQKGACYSDRMVDAARVRHPLKRVGKRGEGAWRRVRWEEAMTEIADGVIDVLRSDGPGAIYWDMGGGMSNGGHGVGLSRTCHLLDTIRLDIDSEVADHHPGAHVTCGKIVFCSSADDCFYSDLILIWGGNPVTTQIPNAHFIHEARYHGAEVVTITPDLNPSAIHADRWLPVNVGADAALGLSLAHVIVEEQLHDVAFMREQTDLPLLVRSDTRRFLRESDLDANGDTDRFYIYDMRSRSVQPAPRGTLALGELEPALGGAYTVETRDGAVTVTPAFSLLRAHLKAYAPEAAAAVTGTPPGLVRDLARRIARARAATVLTQTNFSKFYHGMEMERVQFLVLALCGHFGKKGSGVNAFPWLAMDAVGPASAAPADAARLAPPPAPDNAAVPAMLGSPDLTPEMQLRELARGVYAQGGFISSVILLHQFGGLAPLTGSARRWDPHLKREADAYLQDAFRKGWQIAPEREPRVLFEVGGNLMRRVRGYPKLVEGFLPKLSLFVTVDSRMSTTALYSDYVLPAAAWYERDDLIWATPLVPYAQATTRAAEPLGEAKPDWDVHCLLLKRVQERAIEREARTFEDRSGKQRRLDRVYEDFTFERRFTEDNPEQFLEALVEVNGNLSGATWSGIRDTGHARFTSLGLSPLNIGNATDIPADDTITANTWHTDRKLPWPTLTRRMQFYIDHELYFELGEELPVHKDNPRIGGDHPLLLTSGHTRWSIHGSWRDHGLMLQLQQGEPTAILSPVDATARGIANGDRVRVRNDLGGFEVRAKLSPTLRPGEVVVYHAWEPFQFPRWTSHQAILPTPMNPIQMAGGYFHLQPMMAVGQPAMNDRGVRVEVERLAPRPEPQTRVES